MPDQTRELSDEQILSLAPHKPRTFGELIAFARAAIAADRAARAAPAGWQPIETAPKDKAVILGARGGAWIGKYRPVYRSGYVPDNPWSSLMLNHDHMGEKWQRPTHWMPLPAAPGATPTARSDARQDEVAEALKAVREQVILDARHEGDSRYTLRTSAQAFTKGAEFAMNILRAALAAREAGGKGGAV